MAKRTYSDERITVHWNSERCIHTADCLQALPRVFNMQRRPWVDISAADADAIARTVELCPTGALRYERSDAAAGEEPERPTRVVPAENGPLVLRGALRVETPEGETIVEETRLALCRCGASRNQPFCDNSHLRTFFRSGPSQPFEEPEAKPEPPPDPTTIVPSENGPLRLRGRMRFENPAGELLGEADELTLCRCGRSNTKPVCDGSHREVGFESAAPEVGAERATAESPAAFEPNRGLS